ncbi:hypothetical protein F511_36528 [Dorcoceras hygrometricum]|uniref:Uncharacterized protein n=1 Tax=Dorcoceras hygrometricum TaxID=472368 RepID=A0A2Z7CKL3_9LAMI|nr:hypothetical protein F511_36528 [Dorcoceras hygrometricum]
MTLAMTIVVDSADDRDGSSGIPSDSSTSDKVVGGMDQPQQKQYTGLDFGYIRPISRLWHISIILPRFLLCMANILSDSDVAQSTSTSVMARLEDFHSKRRREEKIEQEILTVRAQN